jgi:hypothetical protein
MEAMAEPTKKTSQFRKGVRFLKIVNNLPVF